MADDFNQKMNIGPGYGLRDLAWGVTDISIKSKINIKIYRNNSFFSMVQCYFDKNISVFLFWTSWSRIEIEKYFYRYNTGPLKTNCYFDKNIFEFWFKGHCYIVNDCLGSSQKGVNSFRKKYAVSIKTMNIGPDHGLKNLAWGVTDIWINLFPWSQNFFIYQLFRDINHNFQLKNHNFEEFFCWDYEEVFIIQTRPMS